MTDKKLPYLATTPEEIKAIEAENVLLIAGYNPSYGGSLIRGTGNANPTFAWRDIEHDEYLFFDSEQVMLPALILAIPEKPEVTLTDEVKEGGYLIAVEDLSLQPIQVPNWINPESLRDVTDSSDQAIKEQVYNARNVDYFGNRIFLITDQQAVRDYSVHKTVAFRSLNPEGQQTAFMILQARGLKKYSLAEEAGADDAVSDAWKGRK